MDARLLDYYNRELRYLRELGGEFAQEFPKVARRLGLDSFECADPYVERLLEGFAFLAARVQLRIDDEFPRFTEQLLSLVCPHYLGPIPSMAVIELQPGSVVDRLVVPRGTALRSPGHMASPSCEYRTARDLTLWPIEIGSVSVSPFVGGAGITFPPSPRTVKAVARLRLRTKNAIPFSRLAINELVVFFRGTDSLTWRLFEAIASGTIGVSVSDPNEKRSTPLVGSTVAPIGTDDDEALLPVGPRAFQGYRLLSEYFAFPARFLFARIAGLSKGIGACEGHEIDLLLALDRYDPVLDAGGRAASLSLSCTPAINLFPKRTDRIELTAGEQEHLVVVDRAQPMNYEVHSILGVQGYGAEGEPVRDVLPFYRQRHGAEPHDQAFYTVHRGERLASARPRVEGARSSYLGTETFLGLVDGHHSPYRSGLSELSVDVLCTNRGLPLLMPVGQGRTDFSVGLSVPVEAVRCVAGPTPPRPSLAVGETAWRLISQLSLNYLTLTNTSASEGPKALRELLSLYADPSDPASIRQIAGVRSTATRPIARRLPLEGPPCFGRGFEITLECDETAFEGTSAYVLGQVLARFFPRYVSVHSFTETVVRTVQRGEIARWPATPGRRPAL